MPRSWLYLVRHIPFSFWWVVVTYFVEGYLYQKRKNCFNRLCFLLQWKDKRTTKFHSIYLVIFEKYSNQILINDFPRGFHVVTPRGIYKTKKSSSSFVLISIISTLNVSIFWIIGERKWHMRRMIMLDQYFIWPIWDEPLSIKRATLVNQWTFITWSWQRF